MVAKLQFGLTGDSDCSLHSVTLSRMDFPPTSSQHL